MADHLAQQRTGGHLLRDLGLVVVLLELCGEQRAALGGLSAETTRVQIARRAGLTVDRLDDCNQILEHAGVLSVERRRAPNGGRHLPSTYTLHEAPSTTTLDADRAPAARHTGIGSAENEYSQGGIPVPAGRQTGTGRARERVLAGRDSGTGRAANGYWQRGERVLAGRKLRHPRYRFTALYHAHERAAGRKGSRNPSP